MYLSKVLFFAGYFAAIGYGVAKTGLDRKLWELSKESYRQLVAETKAVPPSVKGPYSGIFVTEEQLVAAIDILKARGKEVTGDG